MTFFVSEYANGGDLLEFIKKKKRIPEGDARFLFRQLLEALNYMHSKNYVHRDVKCENVFLDHDENVKLGDFGFARSMNPGDSSKTFCGSTAYAAPEITMARPYAEFTVDYWSLGVVLYIMVTGYMPYDEKDIRKMLEKQLDHRIGYSSSVKDHISHEVKSLISALLNPFPKRRIRYAEILVTPWMINNPWLIKQNGKGIIQRRMSSFNQS